MSEQKQITISSIIDCLDNGMSREEIAVHFGVSISEMKEHFKHPKLKGLKRRKKPSSVLVDDTEGGEDLFQEIDNPVVASNDEDEQQDIAAEVASIQEEELEEEVADGPAPSQWDN